MHTSCGVVLTIQCLNSSSVIQRQFKVSFVSFVKWIHQCFVDIRMRQTKSMPKLVCSHPKEICSTAGVFSVKLIFIKMDLSVVGIKRMRQDSSFTIKWIITSMASTAESEKRLSFYFKSVRLRSKISSSAYSFAPLRMDAQFDSFVR